MTNQNTQNDTHKKKRYSFLKRHVRERGGAIVEKDDSICC